MIKNKTVAYIIFVILFLVMWNLLDLIYATFITKSGYSFGGGTDMGLPLLVSLVLGYFLIYRKNDSDK